VGTVAVGSAASGVGMWGGRARFDRLFPFAFPFAVDFDAPPDDERDVSNPLLRFDIVDEGMRFCDVDEEGG
jgi:hypothetical protein